MYRIDIVPTGHSPSDGDRPHLKPIAHAAQPMPQSIDADTETILFRWRDGYTEQVPMRDLTGLGYQLAPRIARKRREDAPSLVDPDMLVTVGYFELRETHRTIGPVTIVVRYYVES
jgi:hypothetical protein